MSWILLYHILQVVTGLGFFFAAGVWFAKHYYWVSAIHVIVGLLILLAEGTSFLAFLGSVFK